MEFNLGWFMPITISGWTQILWLLQRRGASSWVSISREYSFKSNNGTFQIQAGRESHLSGWVNSSFGNLTTYVSKKIEWNSSVEFTNNGNEKSWSMNTKQKRNVKITSAEQADAKISMDIFDTLYPTKFRFQQRLYLRNMIPTHP